VTTSTLVVGFLFMLLLASFLLFLFHTRPPPRFHTMPSLTREEFSLLSQLPSNRVVPQADALVRLPKHLLPLTYHLRVKAYLPYRPAVVDFGRRNMSFDASVAIVFHVAHTTKVRGWMRRGGVTSRFGGVVVSVVQYARGLCGWEVRSPECYDDNPPTRIRRRDWRTCVFATILSALFSLHSTALLPICHWVFVSELQWYKVCF